MLIDPKVTKLSIFNGGGGIVEREIKLSLSQGTNEFEIANVPASFDPNSADFSGMTGQRDLFISFFIHQAYVKVDEKGTEAAAATAVGMMATAMPTNIFRADHPFIFIIQEKDTGNILFMGRVNNPSA